MTLLCRPGAHVFVWTAGGTDAMPPGTACRCGQMVHDTGGRFFEVREGKSDG